MAKRGNLTIYIFPYLFLDKEIVFDGYKLKPSYKKIFDKESPRVKSHLTKIVKSFKFKNTSNINQYTYGTVTIHNKEEWDKLKQFLDTFSTLLRYQELADERGGANYSNFDYAVFEIYRPMSDRKFAFYNGVLNGKNPIVIHYPETQFCPNFDIRPFILQTDGDSQVFRHLYFFSKAYHSEIERKRYVRALEWFNKSFKSDPEIDDLERYTNVAIAFEALFNSPEEAIQTTLATGITTLLGETEEMVHWVKDFYGQRSAIVHGREVSNTYYRGKKSNEVHLDHLLFSRKVFTRCVKAIFSAREQVYTQDLHSELISNERRLQEVLEQFKKTKTVKELYEAKVFDTIDSLSQKDGTGKSESVKIIATKLLPLVKGLLKKQKDSELLKKLDYLVANTETDIGKLAVQYSEFHVGFGKYYFGDKTIKADEIHLLALKGAVYNLTSYACWKLFRDAFNKK